MINFIKNKHGFTLAEVLITLGIIGVVAAMTLPIVTLNARNSELHSRLKKAYNLIENSVLLVATEEGHMDNKFERVTYKDKLIKHFNISRDCGRNCLSSGEMTRMFKTFSNGLISDLYFDDGQFFLVDGSFIMVENFEPEQLMVSVDLNGPYKNPNIWGVDIFTFEINSEGAVIPGGALGSKFSNKNRYCSKTSSDGYNGVGCTNDALFDKDYWKKIKY